MSVQRSTRRWCEQPRSVVRGQDLGTSSLPQRDRLLCPECYVRPLLATGVGNTTKLGAAGSFPGKAVATTKRMLRTLHLPPLPVQAAGNLGGTELSAQIDFPVRPSPVWVFNKRPLGKDSLLKSGRGGRNSRTQSSKILRCPSLGRHMLTFLCVPTVRRALPCEMRTGLRELQGAPGPIHGAWLHRGGTRLPLE